MGGGKHPPLEISTLDFGSFPWGLFSWNSHLFPLEKKKETFCWKLEPKSFAFVSFPFCLCVKGPHFWTDSIFGLLSKNGPWGCDLLSFWRHLLAQFSLAGSHLRPPFPFVRHKTFLPGQSSSLISGSPNAPLCFLLGCQASFREGSSSSSDLRHACGSVHLRVMEN